MDQEPRQPLWVVLAIGTVLLLFGAFGGCTASALFIPHVDVDNLGYWMTGGLLAGGLLGLVAAAWWVRASRS